MRKLIILIVFVSLFLINVVDVSGGGCASNYGQPCSDCEAWEACGNCGTWDCLGTTCLNQGVCFEGATQCIGDDLFTCTSSCSWPAVGLDCNVNDGSFCNGDTIETRDGFCQTWCMFSIPPVCSSTCDVSVTSSENCATKVSTDTDGSSIAYQTGGTVTDYTGCFDGICISATHPDTCSGTVLTEYGANGDSYVSGTKQCQDFEALYCSGANVYRREWGCSGSPGFCNDAAVGNTLIEDCNNRDGWYCESGNTRERRDYTCSGGGSCTYSVPESYSDYGTNCNCNACGSCGGTVQCNAVGSCSGSTPGLPAGYGDDCNPNACGTYGGTIGCDGLCSGSTPANPAGYGDSCGSCGGTIQCDSSCSVSTPGNFGTSCNLNACGTPGGTIKCDGQCSGPTPAIPSEICDSIDNDCDGQTDEGCDDDGDNYCDESMTILGTPSTCNSGGNDCNDDNFDIKPSATETCDLIDNNCDNSVDEGCICTPDGDIQSCGISVGACSPGTQICVGGFWNACAGGQSSTPEICDGLDNDCDGQTDEGCDDDNDNYCDISIAISGIPSTCTAGGNDCNDDNFDVKPGATETCDLIDNNCNDATDEGCYCTPDGITNSCGISVGECRQGTQTCSSGEWNTCTGNIGPTTETCDGKDNNCNGAVDEGCDDDDDDYCDIGITFSGTPDTCTAGNDCDDSKFNVKPGATEACDLIDNDCDNSIDEGCICTPNGITQSCGSSVGECRQGTQTCSSGEWNTCTGNIVPTTETCDGKDNNCNGAVDEGCSCTPNGITQSCGSNVGACEFGEQICTNGEWSSCIDSVVPSIEICTDSKDNDCDGFTDCTDSDCSPDMYSNCCVPSVDQTSGTWSWALLIFEDAGIEYDANLFNSDTSACPDSSCSDTTPGACACYDADRNPVNHKSALDSGLCCGNNAYEFYKSDYYGPECTDNVYDCVWSTGDAQASNTGNAGYWCNLGKWNDCTNAARDIGTKAGGVTCAGISASFEWTPNADVVEENQYPIGSGACEDGLDNDGDGNIDEGCACGVEGAFRDCGSSDEGVCEFGIQTCTNDELLDELLWGSCDGNIEPIDEICDGKDNNCNGAVDEGCDDDDDDYCDIGITFSGTPDTCTAGNDCNDNDASINPAATESCFDLIDNNCDGAIDEGCPCSPSGFDRPCGSSIGECEKGTQECDAVWSTCIGGTEPDLIESCDGLDNNCDSLVDEGCDKDNDDYCDVGITRFTPYPSCSETTDCCLLGGNDCNDNNFNVNTGQDEHCTNFIDDDCNAKTDCQDQACVGTISGIVKDVENEVIDDARIDVLQGTNLIQTAITDVYGNYEILWDPTDPVFCGTFSIIASAETYLSSTKTDVVLPPKGTITEDFTMILGSACEADCTYAGDNTIHSECDGRNECSFRDITAQNACNLAQPGWKKFYGELAEGRPFDVICSCEDDCATSDIGPLVERRIIAAEVACEKENLIKLTKVAVYKGDPVNLVITVCS